MLLSTDNELCNDVGSPTSKIPTIVVPSPTWSVLFSVVELLTSSVLFNEVELSQKFYFSAMIGLYFYNIYQNAVTCYRFYKNLMSITSEFNMFKKYLQQTIEKIDYIQNQTKDFTSYSGFSKHLESFKFSKRSKHSML